MSIDKTMKDHMDAVRNATGTNQSLSINDATKALNDAGNLAFKSKEGGSFQGDLNTLVTPGVHTVWLKPVKNSPEELSGADEGSFVTVIASSGGNWVMQVIGSFYHADFWKRSSISYGKDWSAWEKIGGVTNPGLVAFLRREEVVSYAA